MTINSSIFLSTTILYFFIIMIMFYRINIKYFAVSLAILFFIFTFDVILYSPLKEVFKI